MSKIKSSYLFRVLNGETIRQTANQVSKIAQRFNFEAIAFRGMSGALIAPVLAERLKKPLIMIRKESDDSHSYSRIEGALDAKSCIIVDDLVASGKTLKTMLETLRYRTGPLKIDGHSGCECQAIILYQNDIAMASKSVYEDVANHPLKIGWKNIVPIYDVNENPRQRRIV